MSKQIDNIRLKFSCDADWDSMEYVDGVKHCKQCQKNVYDFTNVKQNEFLRILAENNNNICGRFNPEQMTQKHLVLPAWKKWVSAALLLVGINIFNNKAEAQTVKQNTVKIKFPKPVPTVGDVEVLSFDTIANFPGGDVALKDFILKNMHNDGAVTGKVIVGFNINPDGSLSNYRIMRSLGKKYDEEVVRILKLSPKWKPAMRKGKPVASDYYLPVSFQK